MGPSTMIHWNWLYRGPSTLSHPLQHQTWDAPFPFPDITHGIPCQRHLVIITGDLLKACSLEGSPPPIGTETKWRWMETGRYASYRNAFLLNYKIRHTYSCHKEIFTDWYQFVIVLGNHLLALCKMYGIRNYKQKFLRWLCRQFCRQIPRV